LTTIEELKSSGCPSCKGEVFYQIKNTYSSIKSKEVVALGKHILADLYNCETRLLNDIDYIRNIMLEAAIQANCTIVSEHFHEFSPWGISGVIVIQESHLTIHIWPEYAYAAIDLFTCGESAQPWKAFNYLKQKLESDKNTFRDIARGREV